MEHFMRHTKYVCSVSDQTNRWQINAMTLNISAVCRWVVCVCVIQYISMAISAINNLLVKCHTLNWSFSKNEISDGSRNYTLCCWWRVNAFANLIRLNHRINEWHSWLSLTIIYFPCVVCYSLPSNEFVCVCECVPN